jgi:hypothetical protein
MFAALIWLQVKLQEQLEAVAQANDRSTMLEDDLATLQAEMEHMRRSTALAAAARGAKGAAGLLNPEAQRLMNEEALAREKALGEKLAAAEAKWVGFRGCGGGDLGLCSWGWGYMLGFQVWVGLWVWGI